MHFDELAAPLDLDSCGATVLYKHPVDKAACEYRQVGTVSVVVEIGDGCTPPDAIGDVEGQGADSGGVGIVVVGAVGVAGGETGTIEGILLRCPGLPAWTGYGRRAVIAVEVVLKIGVGLSRQRYGRSRSKVHSSLPAAAHPS